VRDRDAQDAIETIVGILAMLESIGEVVEVHVVVGESLKRVALGDTEQAPDCSFDGDGRGLRTRKCPDAELLGYEGGGGLVDVDNDDNSVEFGTVDPGYVDAPAVCGVALIMGVRWAVAERAWVGGIAVAMR
jgi:hypothetical protein